MVSNVLHLFPPKTNLLFHDVSFSTSLDAPFTVTVQERTVMFVAFEVRSHSVVTTKSARRLAFLFKANQFLKRRPLHFSSPVLVAKNKAKLSVVFPFKGDAL